MNRIRSFTLHFNDDPLLNELWNITLPPQRLFIEGRPSALSLLQRLPEAGLAVVGSREPHEYSQRFLKREIHKLQSSSLIILSGLARGIDSIAHESALEAGLPTIGVIAAGLDIAYPRETLPLRRKILEAGGLIISEYPLSTPAYKPHFLQRNRLIAGWSKATWVVEAKRRSGSLNTARWARENQRTCLTLPCSPGDERFGGNEILLDRDHALAYWGIHSLGAIWLEFATQYESHSFPYSSPHSTQSVNTNPFTQRAKGEGDNLFLRLKTQ
jgi:DNA processing protein